MPFRLENGGSSATGTGDGMQCHSTERRAAAYALGWSRQSRREWCAWRPVGAVVAHALRKDRIGCADAGVPGRIPHDFRRTAVRNMARIGIPERVVMQLAGHKTRSVCDHYNVVSEFDLQAAAERLNAAAGR